MDAPTRRSVHLSSSNVDSSNANSNPTTSMHMQANQRSISTKSLLPLHIPPHCPPLPILEHLLQQQPHMTVSYRGCTSSLERNFTSSDDKDLDLGVESTSEEVFAVKFTRLQQDSHPLLLVSKLCTEHSKYFNLFSTKPMHLLVS